MTFQITWRSHIKNAYRYICFQLSDLKCVRNKQYVFQHFQVEWCDCRCLHSMTLTQFHWFSPGTDIWKYVISDLFLFLFCRPSASYPRSISASEAVGFFRSLTSRTTLRALRTAVIHVSRVSFGTSSSFLFQSHRLVSYDILSGI